MQRIALDFYMICPELTRALTIHKTEWQVNRKVNAIWEKVSKIPINCENFANHPSLFIYQSLENCTKFYDIIHK